MNTAFPAIIQQWLGIVATAVGLVGMLWVLVKRRAIASWWRRGQLSLSQGMLDQAQAHLDASQQTALDNMQKAMSALLIRLNILESNLTEQKAQCEMSLAELRGQLSSAIAAKDTVMHLQEGRIIELEAKVQACTDEVSAARQDLALYVQRHIHQLPGVTGPEAST